MRTLNLFTLPLLAAIALPVHASTLTVPNTFSSGTPAVAAQVNANFTAVKGAVDDNDARIAALESALATLQSTATSQATTISDLQATVNTQATTISTLQTTVNTQATTISSMQSQIYAINNSDVMALESYLTVDTLSDSRGPQVRLSGVNLQLVNGTGTTDGMPNGLGNLIIGYDLVRTSGNNICSDGNYSNDQANCVLYNNTWAISHKTGSHYLIIGDYNNYSQYVGIVSGYTNTSNRSYASVVGGYYNTSSGSGSSVSGGKFNTASGNWSSISGGESNTISISAGGSSISGGYGNTASATYSSVSGGNSRSATTTYNWVAGSLSEAQ